MSRFKIYSKHILTSFVMLVIFIGVIYLSKGLILDFIKNPQNYIQSNLSISEIYFNVTIIFLILISVFISYVVYLLLAYNTRFDLEAFETLKTPNLSKEQFRGLYDSAPVPYIMLGKNAEIHDPNKAALRFFGVFPEDINGKNFFSYLSGGNKEQAEMFFQYYKAHIPINRKEVEMVTKSGQIRSVQLSIFEMKNPGDFSATGLAMIFDITEQKLLDKAKTEFVSLASHQLRSPLATTKWLTEMLMSGNLGEFTPKQAEYLSKLHVANEDMVDLVDALLNVSRIEMGSVFVEMTTVNVEELSENILKEMDYLLSKKNLNIVKQYNGHLQNIKSDPKLLRIVIQNLITNAIKYTPEGGTITITFDESVSEKRIIVSDTGLGIPKEQQNLIFTKLFRADNVRALSTGQGTGLGLYLVKSMVGSIGGNISFVSEENKGSTFTITLK